MKNLKSVKIWQNYGHEFVASLFRSILYIWNYVRLYITRALFSYIWARIQVEHGNSYTSFSAKARLLSGVTRILGARGQKRWTAPQGPNSQNILRQSYHYLMIIPKLRSTYDGRLIYQTSYEEGMILLRNCKIVWDSVRKLAYDIPKINFITFKVTIVSLSCDKLTIILR